MSQPTQRYTNVAIFLHWLIAILLLAQIYVGWTFGDMDSGPARALWFDWHKTLGFVILILSLARLGWRLINPPPPLPADLTGWEKLLARVTHVLFYVVLIGLPLTGWAAVSTGRASLESGAMTLFGVHWPIIPGLSGGMHKSFEIGHEALVKITYVLIVLHVGAALKHHFFDKTRAVSARMPPLRT